MDKRPHSPDGNSQALVKRQRTDDQQIIIGSVTKDVSRLHTIWPYRVGAVVRSVVSVLLLFCAMTGVFV